jgi:ABC-type molybdate transport system substrate-binding protein
MIRFRIQNCSHSQRSTLYYITLSVNLGDPIFSDFYKKASYTSNTGNIVHGEPIYFSVTISEATASNLPESISFVTFLLCRDGQHILQSQGLNYIKPIAEGKLDKIPIVIKI